MKLTELVKNRKSIIYLLVASGVMAAIWDYSKQDLIEKHVQEEMPSADTYVPDGFVLVPIEVQNIESLDAILGNYGVVDLFHPSVDPNGHAKLLARQVKILRAPLDPKKFAVLVPTEQSQALVKIDAPLFVTIHNPKRSQTAFIKDKKAKSRVLYE
jgi:hypothetical protein